MKFAKRLISVLLSLSMLFSLIAQIGITAFAAEKEITNRAEWLSALAKTFQMTVESDNYPDNYFSDLTEASEYYYDVLLAVEFGVVDIEAGDPVDPEGEISREFAAQTLNFCLKFDLENLENEDYQYSFADYEICNYPNDDQVAVNRGWFALDEDGNFCPELTASSDELAFMIDDAKAVIKADAVDENYDSTYEFKDGVIEISSNTDVEILDDNTVVIYNTKYDIKNGDTFVVFSNDIPIVYQAEKVTVNKDNITIRVADKDCEDAVESIDMEEVVDLDASGFIPADGFEIVDEPVSAYSLRKAPSAKNSVNLKKKINLISGNSINIEIKISDIKASYKVKSKEESVTTKVDFNLSYKFDGQFNFTDIAQDDLDDLKSIGTIPFMGIGFIEFKPELNFNGKTEYSQKYNVVLGFTQDKSGTHNISSFKKDTFKFDFEGSCKFGIKVEIGLKILAVKIGVYAEVGAMAKASAETSENENNVSTYCLTLSAYLYFKVGVELKIDFLSWKSNPKIEWEIYKETNSPVRLYFHFENGKSVDRCTVGSKTKPKYVTPSTSQYGSVYEDNISDTGNIVSAGDFGLSTNSDGTATITDYTGSAANLSIPEYINGYRIISIGNWAFDYCTSLTNITIPNSVTSIGNGAFANCTSLESITIP
ncbi:MAG: leucine-rich repeat domain-containing protein, partial [Eubacterium sp.]|nr:leucine-rich repeat domain-containing protein [Eubacterium sp.]